MVTSPANGGTAVAPPNGMEITPTQPALRDQGGDLGRYNPGTMTHPRERLGPSAGVTKVAEGVWRLATFNVNAYLVAGPSPNEWVLVDAGMPGFAHRFIDAANALFNGQPPVAIILTHGHFDHVSSLKPLLREWPNVEVYAHPMELPYLTGRSDYPPPDPTVGGFESQLSRLYPKRGIDISDRVLPLAEHGRVPGLPEWRWEHTPGHTVGHISLFRERDRVLIAGDAVITVDQDHAVDFFLRPPVLHGPPVYFTSHWDDAVKSVRRLADLEPHTLVTGHGQAVGDDDLPRRFHDFANTFTPPAHGRYVGHPPIQDADRGVVALPPAPVDRQKWLFLGGLGALGMAAVLMSRRQA